MKKEEKTEKKNFFPDAPEGLATSKMRAKMERDMISWHGEKAGRSEMMRFLPEMQKLSDVLEKVAKKKLPASLRNLAVIRDNWEKIAGKTAASRSYPLRMETHVLCLEVSHPAYMTAFRTPSVQAALIEKIRALVGPEYCRGIRLVPPGSRKKD